MIDPQHVQRSSKLQAFSAMPPGLRIGLEQSSCNSSGRSWVAGAIMLGGRWRSIHDPLQSDSLGEVDEESARDQ